MAAYVYCQFGKRDGMKSIRGCKGRLEADLATLVWTRGRDFPLARFDGRMKCRRCGSRQVLDAFQPPSEVDRKRALPQPMLSSRSAGRT